MGSVFEHWVTPTSASLLGRFLGRRARHPDEFDCAIRVVAGAVDGESDRWRYRRSAIDPYSPDDVVSLTHGAVTLRLRFTGEVVPRTGAVRSSHRVWPAVEVASGASVEVAADAGEAVRLRLDA